jgi:hypothetical protein
MAAHGAARRGAPARAPPRPPPRRAPLHVPRTSGGRTNAAPRLQPPTRMGRAWTGRRGWGRRGQREARAGGLWPAPPARAAPRGTAAPPRVRRPAFCAPQRAAQQGGGRGRRRGRPNARASRHSAARPPPEGPAPRRRPPQSLPRIRIRASCIPSCTCIASVHGIPLRTLSAPARPPAPGACDRPAGPPGRSQDRSFPAPAATAPPRHDAPRRRRPRGGRTAPPPPPPGPPGRHRRRRRLGVRPRHQVVSGSLRGAGHRASAVDGRLVRAGLGPVHGARQPCAPPVADAALRSPLAPRAHTSRPQRQRRRQHRARGQLHVWGEPTRARSCANRPARHAPAPVAPRAAPGPPPAERRHAPPCAGSCAARGSRVHSHGAPGNARLSKPTPSLTPWQYLDPNKGTGWDIAALSDTDPDYAGSCGRCYEGEGQAAHMQGPQCVGRACSPHVHACGDARGLRAAPGPCGCQPACMGPDPCRRARAACALSIPTPPLLRSHSPLTASVLHRRRRQGRVRRACEPRQQLL